MWFIHLAFLSPGIELDSNTKLILQQANDLLKAAESKLENSN